MDQPTFPFLFFPSVCAIHKVTGNRVYGKEALKNDIRQNSNLSFPLRPSVKILQHSIDVDLVGGLFKKIFRDLNVNPTEYTVQVCLPRSLSTNTQNALVKLLLEDFEVKSVSLTHQALLTLYAYNVSTGIVVDIGDRMDILPVVDGFIVEKGVTRVPHGGQRLIHHMKHALAEKHISLSNDMDSFVVRFISENLSYIPEDYENETKIAPDLVRKSVVLENFRRDDNLIQAAVLDEARFQVPEGLFQPNLWGLDNAGIHQLVQKAIQATGVDVRKKIAENIYVSGGVTTIPGFVERLLKELSILNKPRIVPQVIASKYQYHCSYIGGCEFAQMEVFPKEEGKEGWKARLKDHRDRKRRQHHQQRFSLEVVHIPYPEQSIFKMEALEAWSKSRLWKECKRTPYNTQSSQKPITYFMVPKDKSIETVSSSDESDFELIHHRKMPALDYNE
ncbi:actin [Trichonephila clavipes]|uniref:Actin n=1 Tax=Trichonephila clavipes TaxID=2585209 RepID=A0A8X6W7Z2_TRICX|nr:actin [Trichonephila clavipes]